MCSFPFRQSYDVEMEVEVVGTGNKSVNKLDLKNPFFRYNGQPPAAPPGTHNQSPSEAYWNTTVDAGKSKSSITLSSDLKSHRPYLF